jgi:hypothetical protein
MFLKIRVQALGSCDSWIFWNEQTRAIVLSAILIAAGMLMALSGTT